ncbi:MAG: bifunctional oligoribonuclease/PAP phosphatase NrnA [Treponema sp.]|jgi:phosphoesterase RecJ-like protein|nr:bifunctional oligoribonuclease/PAP phosphatase NrnA [Treponema sp.]
MGSDTGQSSVPDELVQYIKTGSKFIIAGHKEPDGDCVGSQLALRSALLRMGKDAIVCSAGPFKRSELKNYAGQFVGQIAKIPAEEKKSNVKVIVVDCSGMERTGSLQESLEAFPCAVIDHHAAVTHPPSTLEKPVYVDASSPSCTLLIEKLIKALGLELTDEEASFLFFGLCTDTGFFRHLTDKNAYVFEAAARMVHQGANPKEIYKIMNGGKSISSRIILGQILSRVEAYFNGRLLISHETLKEFKKHGFESRDSDSLNKMLLSIEGVEAIAIIRQESSDNCTVSLRSADEIDVSQIAASFGGGGHKNASGLTMKGKVAKVKKIILKSFNKVFD